MTPSSWEGRQSVPCLCGCHHCCFFLLQWTINNPLLWEESWQLWFSPFFLADKGSLNSIIQTEQINNKNTLTTSCYDCKFNILNLPDTLARSLGSNFCFLILVLQYLYGQTTTAMLIQIERFYKKNWQYLKWCGPSLHGSSCYGRGSRWTLVSKKWGGRPPAGVVLLAQLLVFAEGCSCLASSHELMNCHNTYREGLSFLFFFPFEAFWLWPTLFLNYSVHEQTLCELDAALLSVYSLTVCSWGLPTTEKPGIYVSKHGLRCAV